MEVNPDSVREGPRPQGSRAEAQPSLALLGTSKGSSEDFASLRWPRYVPGRRWPLQGPLRFPFRWPQSGRGQRWQGIVDLG